MTIKSQGGQSLGTKILDSQGKEMDLQISSIDISFRVDEPVTANVDLLKIPTEVEILPENIFFYQHDDLQEIEDLVLDGYIKDAIAHIRFMKGML